jgi:hypothetical protein
MASRRKSGGPARQSSVAVEQAPARSSPIFRYLPWILVLLVLLIAAAIRIRLLNTPLERDEGEYAFAGQLVLQGLPPYRELFNMKFPGVYAAYAVIMAVFGQTITGIHIGLLLVNAVTIVLLFLLGRRLISAGAGVAAAAAFALLSLGSHAYGTQAHATHFVIVAAVGACLLLLRGLETGSWISFFLSGFLFAVAVLMKQHAVFFLLFGLLLLVLHQWRKPQRNWPAVIRSASVLLAGTAIPLAVTVGSLSYAGSFDKFWFWTFQYAREYVAENSLAQGWEKFKDEFSQTVGPNTLIWLFAGVGLIWLLVRRKKDRPAADFAVPFLFCSFLAVCPGLYFRGHYFVLMMPAVALLAGAAAASAASLFRSPKTVYFAFAAALAFCVSLQFDYLFTLTPFQVSRLMYGQNPFPEAVQVGAWIRNHTSPDARIVVIGSEPEIYFYSHRRSATGHMYTYGMMELQPFAVQMQKEMIHDIETRQPEYVIYVGHPGSWLAQPNSSHQIFDWWTDYGTTRYRYVGVADIISDDVTEYHLDNPEGYTPKSPFNLIVFKRREP